MRERDIENRNNLRWIKNDYLNAAKVNAWEMRKLSHNYFLLLMELLYKSLKWFFNITNLLMQKHFNLLSNIKSDISAYENKGIEYVKKNLGMGRYYTLYVYCTFIAIGSFHSVILLLYWNTKFIKNCFNSIKAFWFNELTLK